MGYMKAIYTDKIDCPMTLKAVGGTERNGFVPLPSSTPTPFDDNQELAMRFKTMSIPTLIVFRNGEEVKRSVGVISKSEILELVGTE